MYRIYNISDRKIEKDLVLGSDGSIYESSVFGLVPTQIKGLRVDRWTGIYDKNNTPIFDNDIVKHTMGDYTKERKISFKYKMFVMDQMPIHQVVGTLEVIDFYKP